MENSVHYLVFFFIETFFKVALSSWHKNALTDDGDTNIIASEIYEISIKQQCQAEYQTGRDESYKVPLTFCNWQVASSNLLG